MRHRTVKQCRAVQEPIACAAQEQSWPQAGEVAFHWRENGITQPCGHHVGLLIVPYFAKRGSRPTEPGRCEECLGITFLSKLSITRKILSAAGSDRPSALCFIAT